MHEVHLYLSLIPQALVASMLPPEDFGRYYATGTRVHVQGEAIFFELDPAFRSGDFPFHILEEKCVPGPSGEPKKSFMIDDIQLYPSARNEYSIHDRLFVFFQAPGLEDEVSESGRLEFVFYKGDQEFLKREKEIKAYPQKGRF